MPPAAFAPSPPLVPRVSVAPLPSHPFSTKMCASRPYSSRSYTLYSIPVSFFAARVRLLVHREAALSSAVEIAAPPGGGMKSPEHLALNPLGKVPSLCDDAEADAEDAVRLFESTAIAEFLLDAFGLAEKYRLDDALGRGRVAMVVAFVENYLVPLNDGLYRAMDADVRESKVERLQAQLDVLEDMVEDGAWLVGDRMTMADVCLFGVFVLYAWTGPRFFGFAPNERERRPKLTRWYETICSEPAAKRTRGEVEDALAKWKDGGRWEKFGIFEKA